MKLHLSLLTSLAAIASNVFADTAVTDPVGYVTSYVAGSSSGSTYSVISPTLTRAVEYAGLASSATPTAINFPVSTFSPAQVAAFATGNYWVEVTNGGAALEGGWTNITGATSSSVTTADSMVPFIPGATSTIKIRAHTTISDYLGTTNSAGLGAGPDAGIADEVVFLDASVAPAPAILTSVFYDGTGWYDSDGNPADTKIIEPGQGLLTVRKLVPDISFVHVGHVKTGQTQISVYPKDNIVPIPQSVGVTLAASGLYTGSSATGVNDGPDAGIADEVVIFNNEGLGISYFQDSTGWFDVDGNPADSTILKEGGGAYLIRKAPGAAFSWKAPAVVIAP